jgi:molybdopterin/thiamine biosynthesis adenylyltransferase
VRLGVGLLVLVDHDRVEEKNLSRILNSGKEDAYCGRPKVHVMGAGIARIGLGQELVLLQKNLATKEAVCAVAECDVVFGCMDVATALVKAAIEEAHAQNFSYIWLLVAKMNFAA